MTGDVEEECSLLRISQLEDPVSSNAAISIAQPTSAALISSNMTAEDSCIYTAAIPSDLVGSFPEGTVLQIMPDSTIVALAMKNLPASTESSLVFKDSTFPIESSQHPLNLPNLLTETSDNHEQQNVDVCSEENMSDIDLSFLNEAEENSAIADPKCLNESAVKELQGIIGDASSQSLSLLENNLNLSDSNVKSSQIQEQATSEPNKDSGEQPSGNVVMIDVTKPIQLSQNSLIMVNGQKCILQQDPQTGQVIAYPVKEQEKPRKRRGRPRKATVEQAAQESTEATQTENISVGTTETLSEEEREKGLQEIINDDGALVRRSSRKRKLAKTLRDYETGNLKQELGSDVDEMEILENDIESVARRKKARGPGRPRKYMKPVENVVDDNTNNGARRQRGRPKKIVPENEPTQAFLVHTADGQVLMMQVPLSSIPPGITLQEMAQEIANKLNLGLSQANNTVPNDEKDKRTKELHTESDEEAVGSTQKAVQSVAEPALQDHSIGSTTNFPSIQVELNSTDENSNIVDSTCQDMINMNQIIGDPVCGSEVILESESCTKDVILTENISDNQNKLNVLEVPQCSEENFCINMPSTTASIDSTSMLCSLDGALMDHDFCIPRPDASKIIKENSKEIHISEHAKLPKEFFAKSNVLKNRDNFQLLLQTESDVISEPQNINIDELLNKTSNSENSDKLILSENKLKSFDITYNAGLIDGQKCIEKQYIIEQMPAIDCSDQMAKDVFKSVHAEAKTSIEEDICLQNECVIESAECSDVISSEYVTTPETTKADLTDKSAQQFVTTDIANSENQMFEIVLPFQKAAPSLESSVPSDNTIVTSSATTVIPVPEKVLPMLIPVQSKTESKNCKICQMPYFTEEEIVEHFKDKHPKCICMECNYMNEHPYVIKRHAFRHTNNGCVCKICNKKYKDLYILKMHIKMVHLPPDVLYACEICEKKFTRKAHLKRHLRIHAPIKQYQCPHCDYKGCEKSDITKHLLIHDEPKFKCDICGKAFRHAKNKELHLKRHSGQRDYKCAACGFFGYTYTDIRKHIERRHAFACSQCKQVFSDVEIFKEHKRIGTCQPNVLEENKEIKVEDGCIIVDNKETALLDEMPLDLLEADQPQVMTISECSEETLSALQNGQLIMTSVEGILNAQNGQLIVEGLEDNNIITPDNLSVISVDKDTSKTITLVTTSGKNLSLPLKNSSPLECIATVADSSISEFILPNEPGASS